MDTSAAVHEKILTLGDVGHLSIPDQFFSYADAYRSSSALICGKVQSDETYSTWPYASVVLMLAAHSTEIFLKGALLKGGIGIWETHNIQRLAEKYREIFPGPAFTWDIPFANPNSETELIALMKQTWPGIDEGELKAFMAATPVPSILYRYPVTIKNENRIRSITEWRGSYGFMPTEFLSILNQIKLDFKRLRSELDKLPG